MTAVPDIPFLDLSGPAHDRGLAHGKALAASIAANLETYLRRFEASGLARDAAMTAAAEWDRVITRDSPDYAAEMHGIAKGAGLPRNAIALLNARYETAFTLYGKDARAKDSPAHEPDGCTTAGILPEASADGHTYLLQNWDWLADIHGHCAVIRITNAPGIPDMIFLTEAGIVGGKMGLNAHGIGLVENGLASSHDGANPWQKPFHVRCREVLQGRTLHHAMLPVLATKRTCSGNFVIGDAGGEIIDLETSPGHVAALHPEDGIIAHSNHFLAPGHGESQMQRIAPNTLFRAARMRRLLQAARGAGGLTRDAMIAAMSDGLSHPHAICRHPDPEMPRARQTMTVAAVILDLDRREMWVANGPPSIAPFKCFALNAATRAQVA